MNQNDLLRRRIDELEFILHKSHKRNLISDILDKRIAKIEEKMGDFTHEIINDVESVKFQQNLLQEKVSMNETNIEAALRKCEDNVEKLFKMKSDVTREVNLRVILGY